MKLYKMILDDKQLHLIKDSLDSYVRLGVGQIHEALLNLGFRLKFDSDYFTKLRETEIENAIGTIKSRLFNMSFDQSYTINDDSIDETIKMCYDIFETIKLKLAENITGEMTLETDNNHSILQIEICTEEEAKKYMAKRHKPSTSKISPVTSIYDLKVKCNNDNPEHEKYQKLAIIAARNLGCPQSQPTLQQAFSWFDTNIMETQDADEGGENGVVGEINFCLDLVE